MKLLQIVTFYVGTNIVGLPISIDHQIYLNKSKIKTEIITKTKEYGR